MTRGRHKARVDGRADPGPDDWRKICPVRPEHKSIFPADVWLWQPGAAALVWGVLKTAGGKLQAEELTRRLAELRNVSRRQARGLRNRGLTVLEAFDLIEIERIPAPRGSRRAASYGSVSIIRGEINVKAARQKKDEAAAARWGEMFRRAFTSPESRDG